MADKSKSKFCTSRVEALLIMGALTGAAVVILSMRIDRIKLSPDCYLYVDMAVSCLRGDLSGGHPAFVIPPLHIWMLGIPGYFGYSLFASGILMSMTFFALSVPAIYIVTSHFFAQRAAFYACLIFITHPAFTKYGVQPLRESLFTFLVSYTVLFLHLYFRERKLFLAILAGLFAGAANCTRIEGYDLIAAMVILGLGMMWSKNDTQRSVVIGCVVSIITAILLTAAVSFFSSQYNSRWTAMSYFERGFSKISSRLVNAPKEEITSKSSLKHPNRNGMHKFQKAAVAMIYPSVIVLAAIYFLFGRRSVHCDTIRLLLALCIITLILRYVAILSHQPCVKRHFLLAAFPLIYIAGEGAAMLEQMIIRISRQHLSRIAAITVVAGIILAASLPKTFKNRAYIEDYKGLTLLTVSRPGIATTEAQSARAQ